MSPQSVELPAWVEQVFARYKTMEMSTVSRRGAPSTVPMGFSYDAERQRFLTTTCVAFPQKVYNLKRNPAISLLFSYPVGSGLGGDTPVVLVQGTAVVADDLVANRPRFEELTPRWIEAQPSFGAIWHSPFWRWMYRYYLLRIFITITPHRFLGWEDGDLTKPATVIETVPADPNVAAFEIHPRPTRILPTAARHRMENYPHGVFSVRDRDTGLIASVPCRCRAVQDDGLVVLHIPAGSIPALVEPYPAGLCFHKHNEAMADIGQQTCTGTASVEADGTVSFHPEWTAGFEVGSGPFGKFMFAGVTRMLGPKYFRKRPGPTPEMDPRPH